MAACLQGVSYNKSLSRWESRLRHNGRTFVIGSYATELEAARAHDCAAMHMRGPQANFPAMRYPNEASAACLSQPYFVANVRVGKVVVKKPLSQHRGRSSPLSLPLPGPQ